MSLIATAAKTILSNISYFSHAVLRLPLRQYQIDPITAVLKSILHRDGLEFLIVMPRQSGKNELIAHLLVYLLNIYQRIGGNIVFAAIGDGTGRMAQRLEDRLDNIWNTGHWQRAAKPTRRLLGKSAVVFLSSHPQASARGETAHHLLVIDEMQDQHAPHIEQVFTPMRAANNATAVYIGTVKFTHDALWQKKLQLEKEQTRDGRARVFFITPDQVIAENPHYHSHLESQIRKYGRSHPIVKSEYFLEPIDSEGGLFPPRRLALMQGQHPRQHQPAPNTLYIATLDTAGQDEAATDPIAQLTNPARDYTVVTIFALLPGATAVIFHAVDVFIDHGSRHFEDYPGRPALSQRINTYLDHWHVNHTISDATGVGEGLTNWLQAQRGATAVTPFKFNRLSKAQLGSAFISLIETGRFKYWHEEEPYSDSWWMMTQAAACAYEMPPDGTFDRDLKWSVPASHKTPTPDGNQPTHDDRLLSAALIAHADDLIATGKLTTGTAESYTIAPTDPLDNLSF